MSRTKKNVSRSKQNMSRTKKNVSRTKKNVSRTKKSIYRKTKTKKNSLNKQYNARIILGNNSGGIVPDMKTIKSVIENCGIYNNNIEIVIWNDIKEQIKKNPSKPKAIFNHVSIQIFIEHVFLKNPLKMFPSNKSYIFVNQEYIQDWDLDRIRDKTVIPLCKTHYGFQSLKKLGITNAKYVGFGMMDNRKMDDMKIDVRKNDIKNDEKKIPNLFIHIVGSSPLKGTKILIDTWVTKHIKEPLIITISNIAGGNSKLLAYWKSLHPKVKDLPDTIIQEFREEYKTSKLHLPKFESVGSSSIYLYNGILDYEIIKFLQKKAEVHMCPSLLEGWGQYIDEGRRNKAVVLILDSPPINELLDNKSGILVKATNGPPMKQLVPYGWTQYSSKEGENTGLYTTYKTTINDLYNGVKRILDMSLEEKRKMGQKAYERSQEDYENFKERFGKVLLDYVNLKKISKYSVSKTKDFNNFNNLNDINDINNSSIQPIYHNGTNLKANICINKNKIIPIKSNVKIIFSDFNETDNIHHILAKEILYIWKITKNNSNIIIILINYSNSNNNKWRLSLLKLLYKNVYVLSEIFSNNLNTMFLDHLKNKYEDKNKYTFASNDPYNRIISSLRNKERFLFLNNNKDELILEYNKNFNDNSNIKANYHNIQFININYFLLDYIICKINYKELNFLKKIREQLNLKINDKQLKIGFIYRNTNRILYDYESKVKYNKNVLVNDILEKECKKLNIPFKIGNFDNSTFKEQSDFLKDVKILIACHGGALTNMFLLPPKATIFEISFRKYLYCDPVCKNHQNGTIPYTQDCFNRSKLINGNLYDNKTKKLIYARGDYHNLAELFNIKYQEIFINDVSEYYSLNKNLINDVRPIFVKNIYIDTNAMIDKIKKLY